jgi:ATP-dependent DNA helicase RecG
MRDYPITEIKGVGGKTAGLFHKLGVDTAEDLLRFYPRDYEEYRPAAREIGSLVPDTVNAYFARLIKSADIVNYGRYPVTTLTLRDEAGSLAVVWYNMPWLRKMLQAGRLLVFRGRVVRKRNRLTMEQPEIFTPEQYEALSGTFLPIYPQTKGLGNKTIQKAVRAVLADKELTREYLPENLREAYELAEINFAVEHIHFPDSREQLLYARKRLVFDEFFLFAVAAKYLRGKKEDVPSAYPFRIDPEGAALAERLPYRLTGAQKKVLGEIYADLSGGHVMKRLVQGDVGSGKTVVAFLALLQASLNGFQGALMAPTEVLAEQHYAALMELAKTYGLPVRPVLLTGALKAKDKREAQRKIREHEADIVIGTHALIQDKVEFDRLALVITDEQHRFGVEQRTALEEKGGEPHVLVMSATPIPRTLAVILYGDLDISVIDELPAGRRHIKNAVVGPDYRENAYRFIAREVAAGRQAYLICPMVEPGEMQDLENVTDTCALLRKRWKDGGPRVALLHGRMKPGEKNAVMEKFAAGEADVLVSTTVVEVGINVPNATVMMIENAERFGLAQLHQLRGRVGRGDAQSYCILVNTGGKEAEKRLDILKNSDDGFFIANEDLRLRGPGDIFGVRQSGDLEFQLADIYTDAAVLKDAVREAEKLLRKDPELRWKENAELKKLLDRYLRKKYSGLTL